MIKMFNWFEFSNSYNVFFPSEDSFILDPCVLLICFMRINTLSFNRTFIFSAMIDNIGGADRVNNFISALNINTISNQSLKKMKCRAGSFVEKVAKQSGHNAAKETFDKERK